MRSRFNFYFNSFTETLKRNLHHSGIVRYNIDKVLFYYGFVGAESILSNFGRFLINKPEFGSILNWLHRIHVRLCQPISVGVSFS